MSPHIPSKLCLRLNPRWFIQREESLYRQKGRSLATCPTSLEASGWLLNREMLTAVHSPPHCMPPHTALPPSPQRWGHHSSKGLVGLAFSREPSLAPIGCAFLPTPSGSPAFPFEKPSPRAHLTAPPPPPAAAASKRKGFGARDSERKPQV